MKKYVKQTFIILFLSLVVSIFSIAPVKAETVLKKGDTVPDFSLPDGLTGKTVYFDADIKDKSPLIALVFMSTTCSACKAELTMLSYLANDYEDDFVVYAVSIDLNGSKTVPHYNKTFGFNVNYLLDPDFNLPRKFGFTFTPAFILLKGDGRILYSKDGYDKSYEKEITSVIKKALR